MDDDDTWDTQFLEAISAAMDAMEEEENMWNAPLPSLEALEAAMEELPRCAYTKERKKPDTLYSNIDRAKIILEYKVSSVIIII